MSHDCTLCHSMWHNFTWCYMMSHTSILPNYILTSRSKILPVKKTRIYVSVNNYSDYLLVFFSDRIKIVQFHIPKKWNKIKLNFLPKLDWSQTSKKLKSKKFSLNFFHLKSFNEVWELKLNFSVCLCSRCFCGRKNVPLYEKLRLDIFREKLNRSGFFLFQNW